MGNRFARASAQASEDRHDARVRHIGPPLSTLAMLAALHPHTRSSGVDYAGLFLAALASWALNCMTTLSGPCRKCRTGWATASTASG